jgi:hypothetical protein
MDRTKFAEEFSTTIIEERDKFERLAQSYEQACVRLFVAAHDAPLPKLWHAASEACDAEYELTGGDGPAGRYFGTLNTPDCYEPGDPCAGRSEDNEYCCTGCPLRGFPTGG